MRFRLLNDDLSIVSVWEQAIWHPSSAASRRTLSARSGGSVDYVIDFPESEAGMRYALLASATQSKPMHLAGVSIPLGRDQLLERMLRLQPPSVFTRSHGTLDENGRAIATLKMSPRSSGVSANRKLYLLWSLWVCNGRRNSAGSIR